MRCDVYAWELYLVEIDVLNIQQSFNNICYKTESSSKMCMSVKV